MEGRGLKRTVTLSEQLATDEPSDCDETGSEDEDSSSSPVAAPAAPAAPPAAPPAANHRLPRRRSCGDDDENGRTLLDIIKDEREVNGSLISGAAADASSHVGLNWRSFKDRLRLRRAGSAAFAAAASHPISDPELVVAARPQAAFFRSLSRAMSGRSDAAPEPPDDDDDDGSSEPAPAPDSGDQPGTISLMALLGQSDEWDDEDEDEERSSAGGGEAEDGKDEEEDGDGDGEGSGDMVYVCCVCMVRHKGAAFIPCGHTFCRLCSRELWVSRGNCPLCNGYILEILDIF